MNKLKNKLYQFRFEVFLMTQLLFLFGALVFSPKLYETILSPLFLLMNNVAGIILISKKRKIAWLIVFLFLIESFLFSFSFLNITQFNQIIISKVRFFIFSLFYGIVTFEIIKTVWQSKIVNRNVIFGLMSGYISLGFIGFFILLSVDIWYPNSFNGIEMGVSFTEELMYFSYITLMSIGYGDITPVTIMAQKATMFIGLMGQFYMVILTAIIVGKFINQTNRTK